MGRLKIVFGVPGGIPPSEPESRFFLQLAVEWPSPPQLRQAKLFCLVCERNSFQAPAVRTWETKRLCTYVQARVASGSHL
eukprot:8817528-Pyramimonas_sp.AAC.1